MNPTTTQQSDGRQAHPRWKHTYSTHHPVRLAVILGVAILALFGSCDLLDQHLEPYEYDTCRAGSDVDVAGEWTISGHGTRSNCEDDDFDGEFRLYSRGLDIIQDSDHPIQVFFVRHPDVHQCA